MKNTVTPYDVRRTTPQLLTIAETAVALGVSRATVYRLVNEGALAAVRVRAHLRIAEDELRRFVELRTREAA